MWARTPRQVRNLFHDLRGGIVLLRVIDTIREGSVNFRTVSFPPPPPSTAFQVQNDREHELRCARLVKEMALVAVEIQGCDIVEGNVKLTLALVWQLMREHSKDSRLRDSRYFLYIMDYLKPGCVNYSLLVAGEDGEGAGVKENAR